MTSQFLLRVFEFIHHRLVFLQGLNQHTVLNGFLQDTLHLAVGISNLTSELTHLTHIDLAESQEYRNHDDDDNRENLVHGEKIEECTEEHRQYTQGIWNCLRKEIDHSVDICLQSVEYITRMQSFPAMPFRAKNTVEHTLLHTVLCLDAQEIANPYRRNIEGEICKYQKSHDSHSPVDVALDSMGSHVDGTLHRPNLRQAHAHRQQANGSIEDSLQLVAPPCPPKPYKQSLDVVLKLRNLKHHLSLWSAPHINFSLKVEKYLWLRCFTILMVWSALRMTSLVSSVMRSLRPSIATR